MKTHREAISSQALALSPRFQALFCLLCAERLSGCCWAYQQSTGADLAPCSRWIRQLYSALSQHQGGALPLDAAINEMDTIVPTEGTPLAVQAQSGVLCTMNAVRALQGQGTEAVLESVNAVVDALDNFVFFVQQELVGRADSPEEAYPLLVREMTKQLDDMAFLSKATNLGEADIARRRATNRQYAVPAAVSCGSG